MFGMTTDGYENLTLNMQDIKAYLLEQKQNITTVQREYYEEKTKMTQKSKWNDLLIGAFKRPKEMETRKTTNISIIIKQ